MNCLSIVCLELRDYIDAEIYIEKALNYSIGNHEKHWEGNSRILTGRISGKKNPSQMDSASDSIMKGIKILEQLKLRPYAARGNYFSGELETESGQKDIALENLKKAGDYFQEMGMDNWLNRTREVLGRL